VVSLSPPLSHESRHSHEHSCPPFYRAASHKNLKPHHFRRRRRYLQVTVTHGVLNQRQLEVDVGDEDIFDQFAHAADAKNNDDPHRERLFFRRHTTRLASPGRPSHSTQARSPRDLPRQQEVRDRLSGKPGLIRPNHRQRKPLIHRLKITLCPQRLPPPQSLTCPLKNTPHARMAPYRL
jgi:hypothetical protein